MRGLLQVTGLAAPALGAALAGCSASAEQSATCPGPREGWATPADGLPHMVIVNRISVSGTNALKWNGVEISRERLREYLRIVRDMEPLPFTILQPGRDVDCAFLEAVRDDLAGEMPCEVGACGEGDGRWPDDPLLGESAPRAGTNSANARANLEAAADAMEAEPPMR